MTKLITIGIFDYKYIFMIIFFIGKEIYLNLVVYEKSEKINENKFLDSLLMYFGNVLCIFPALITNKICYSEKEKEKDNYKSIGKNQNIIKILYNNPYQKKLSKFDILNIFLISLLSLTIDFAYIVLGLINDEYNEEYIFMEFLIWFFFPKFLLKTANYNHQLLSIIIITVIGIIKCIKNIYDEEKFLYRELLLETIIYIGNGIFYGYIYGLMEYKLFSAFKCCYTFGSINTVLLIILYFIVTYIPCKSSFFCEGNEHFDDIHSLYKDLGTEELLILVSYSILSGMDYLFINIIMYNYTTYHILIIFHIEKFINRIMFVEEKNDLILPIIYFFFEFICILIFLEIIELNFCGLSFNLRRNIEKRALFETRIISNDSGSGVFVDDDENYYIHSEMAEFS